MGGGKGGKKESQTIRLDRGTQRYVDENRDIAGRLAGNIFNRPESFFGGPNALMQGGVGAFGDLFGASQGLSNLGLGLGAAGAGRFMQGGLNQLPGIVNQIASPQLQAAMPLFAQQQQIAGLRNDQNATAQGAFGGVRQEIGAQQAMHNEAMRQNQFAGNLLGQSAGQGLGFIGQQQGQNLQLANLGLGQAGRGLSLGGQFAGNLFGAGQSFLGLENQQRQEDLFRATQGMGLRQGAIGPYGQTTTAQQPSNKFGSMLGGAATGFGVGGPLGAGLGAGAGLLFG
jgi:hypothetical protein